MSEPHKPFFLQALDALKTGDRRGAAALLARQLAEGNTSARNLGPVGELAAHIGEGGLAIEAARRAVVPGALDSLINYWGALATYGRSDDALADIASQSASIRNHPSVLHVRGTIATQFGRFEEARDLFRQALAGAPNAMPTWFSLAMIKTFASGDPDLEAMERLERQAGGPPDARASLCYGIAKAWDDVGEPDRAFGFYAKGAALRRQSASFDVRQFGAGADQVMREFTSAALERLVPSGANGQRSLFVTGLPRSGTTLVEQILVGHSEVADGAEVNLFGPALFPVGPIGLSQALAYEQRATTTDPWGEIGRDYAGLIDARFRSPGRIVDKSLNQSLLIGLMLHALPDARIAWLRRSPDDVAWSCFRTYFSTGQPWTWSMTDIADMMRIEDRLFEHWRAVFPDRILTVPYEELVQSPQPWSAKLQQHFRLNVEAGIESRAQPERAVVTASVGQVREPISTSRIGQAAAFERHLKPFRDRYYA